MQMRVHVLKTIGMLLRYVSLFDVFTPPEND
jgi:hypothetical protein